MHRLAHWITDKAELAKASAPLRIGPTATLALAISHRWEPEQLFVILTAYGDESGTHAESPVQMLAAYVATLGQWNGFDLGWHRAIKRSGLPGYFHATEHWNTEAGAKFAPLQAKLRRKHILFGCVVELDKKSYENHYIAGNRLRKPQLDTRYGICFRYLLAFLVTRVPILLQRSDLSIQIVLEEGAAGSADALRIMQQLRKQPETQDMMKMIDGLSFAPKDRWPGLQTSDGLAFGALKMMPTNPPLIDLPKDAPLSHLQNAAQFKPPVYHCRLDETHLGPLKADLETLVEIRKNIAQDAIAARNGRNEK